MSHRRTPHLLTALASASIAFASAASAAERPLFNQHIVPAAEARRTDRFLIEITQGPSARQVNVVQADAAQVTVNTPRLTFNVVPGRNLEADVLESYRNDDGTIVWTGMIGGTAAIAQRLKKHGPNEIVEDPRNLVTIVRDGDMLTGSVRVRGQLFTIAPIAKGNHVIVEVDESRVPAKDDPERVMPVIPMPMSDAERAEAKVKQAAPTEITVMVAFTRHAANSIQSPRSWAQAVIADANRGYEGSQAQLRLKLADVQVTQYREYSHPQSGTSKKASFYEDLSRFVKRNDGHMDSLHRDRNEAKADVMILVRRRNDELCGTAESIGSRASTAFAVVAVDCGAGNYTFHHEIGHLQGARHDPANDAHTTPKAYAHGVQRPDAPEGGYRTVMAYPCEGTTQCPQIPYFSTPDLWLNGVPMGTPELNDNTRAIDESRKKISRFR